MKIDPLLKARAEKAYTIKLTNLVPTCHPDVGWPEGLVEGTVTAAYLPNIKYLMEILELDEETAEEFQLGMKQSGTLVIHGWYNTKDAEDPLVTSNLAYEILGPLNLGED